jgi:hypothetical protein
MAVFSSVSTDFIEVDTVTRLHRYRHAAAMLSGPIRDA